MLRVKNILCITSKKYFNSSKYRSSQHQRHQAAMKKANSIPARQRDLQPLFQIVSCSDLCLIHPYHPSPPSSTQLSFPQGQPCQMFRAKRPEQSAVTHIRTIHRAKCVSSIFFWKGYAVVGMLEDTPRQKHSPVRCVTREVNAQDVSGAYLDAGCRTSDASRGRGSCTRRPLRELQENHHSCEVWAM